MWLLRGRSRVVNPLAGGEGGTRRDTGPAEPVSGRCQATRHEPARATKETAMHPAQQSHNRQDPSPRAYRARALPAVVARRLRTVLGGSP